MNFKDIERHINLLANFLISESDGNGIKISDKNYSELEIIHTMYYSDSILILEGTHLSGKPGYCYKITFPRFNIMNIIYAAALTHDEGFFDYVQAIEEQERI